MKTALLLTVLSLFSLEAMATISITVQGVVRDSAGDLVMVHSPVGGIRAAFYHATYCNGPVNGDATFTGCAPSGGAGSEVINPFTIVTGAFSVTVTPQGSTLSDMATSSSGWYVKLKGEFSPGAPVGEFLIPVNSVPFSNVAATSALVANTVASGNSIISAINSTASTDTKIDADRLNIDGGSITTGTIAGDTIINTSGTIKGAALISASGTAASVGVQVGSSAGTGLYSSAANKLDFTTNGMQRMGLDANGNLGLGQTTPTAKLDIADTTLSGSGALAGSILNLAQTWNTTGSPTAFKLNVTDTASNAASLLMNLQVGGVSKFAVRKDGNVGIGTTTPAAKLEVQGQVVSREFNVATGASVDFANGNVQSLNNIGGPTITLSNMVKGGTYTLVVTDTTSRTYTFNGCSAAYFSPTNAATVDGTRTVYTFLAIQNGAGIDCYISWITGFN